jgi:Flp pilus assembly protein TadG
MVRRRRDVRRAVAAVELAVLLPFLAAILVIAVDWSRVFYYSLTIENCARNGALYASDPYSGFKSPYASITDAALADATNLSPQPTVASSSGTDANSHSYVDCTVTYTFQTVTNLPLVGKSRTIQRTVRMYTAVQLPN